MDMIWTISFKVTAESEVRKKMFCVLLRRRVVSALLGMCSFIAMKCVYIGFLLSITRIFS